MKNVRIWATVSLLLGAALAIAGWRLRGDPTLPPYELPGATIAIVEGALLALVGLGVGPTARRLAPERHEEAGDGCAAGGKTWLLGHPYTRLFLVSFVALFVEVMLIRYCGSQVRVFSFYKNVPLIGSFLGLGLGCWLGRGRPRHAFLFLLWLVPFATLLATSPLVLGRLLGKLVALGSAEHVLGDYVQLRQSGWRQELPSQLLMAGFCVATLVAVTMLFSLLGRLLGDAFEGLPRLPAYTVNILGSLAGIVVFVGLSYLRSPPWVWFAVGLAPLLAWMDGRGRLLRAVGLGTASVLAVWPSYGQTVWSPYQKLVGHVIPQESGGEAYLVQISDVFYQLAFDLRPEAIARTGTNPYPHYDAVYGLIPRPQKVLVVGSGTGNDVAAALRAGADHVDAVDIDPVILEMGRVHHPEHPYSDPRVTMIVNDARAAFRHLPARSYDAVVFGLLDSHTQLGTSSVRLDNYVFTLESFEAARRLVKPGGHLIVTAATFRQWFQLRLADMLQTTVGGSIQMMRHGVWSTFVGEVPGDPVAGAGAAVAKAGAGPKDATLPSDDWPFLYLPAKRVPMAYVLTVLTMVIASIGVLRIGGLALGRFDGFHGHLFFLGAAFLLMEVHAVNRLALLFGTTWLVSAVTIAIVLVLIVLANLTVLLVGAVPHALAYGVLFVSLVASYWVQPGSVLGEGPAAAFGYGLALLSPVYFAGLVFARSFRAAEAAGPAIGANILGSVLGGWAEYSTMGFGIRALVLLAMAFYALSCLALLARNAPSVAEVANHSGALRPA